MTLIEEQELASLGVAPLDDAVRDADMAWYHLPVRHVGVPGAVFEEAWLGAGAQIRFMLRDGFNVLVHCKGGLGRAGMVAARLLTEVGWTPEVAFAAIRRARPGAIETSAQVRHVRSARVAAEARPDTSLAGIWDRALGAMLGLALGDANWPPSRVFPAR